MKTFLYSAALIILLPLEPLLFILSSLNDIQPATMFKIKFDGDQIGNSIVGCVLWPTELSTGFKGWCLFFWYLFIVIYVLAAACCVIFCVAAMVAIYLFAVFMVYFVACLAWASFGGHTFVVLSWNRLLLSKEHNISPILDSHEDLNLGINFEFDKTERCQFCPLLLGLFGSLIWSPITAISLICYWFNKILIRPLLLLPLQLLIIPTYTTLLIYTMIILYCFYNICSLELFLVILGYHSISFMVLFVSITYYYGSCYGLYTIGLAIFGPMFISCTWVIPTFCLRISWYFGKPFLWNIIRFVHNDVTGTYIPTICYSNDSYSIIKDVKNDLQIKKIGNYGNWQSIYVLVGILGSIIYFPITILSSVLYGLQLSVKYILRMTVVSLIIPSIASLMMWVILIMYVSGYYNAMYEHTVLTTQHTNESLITTPHVRRRLLLFNSTTSSPLTTDQLASSWYTTTSTIPTINVEAM
eukprot:428012_1